MSASSPKSIFERGAWYVLIQAILIGLIFFGPKGTLLITDSSFEPILMSLGISMGLCAGLIIAISVINLGKNLTPLPCPRDNAQLVQTGLYRFVRHPIYFGVILAAIAWFLVFPYTFIFLYAIALILLFDVKARREEVWLVECFPTYIAYQAKVKKLIPCIY